MGKGIFYFLIIFFLIPYGCGGDNVDKTIDDLIGHFKENEIVGQNYKILALKGAIDGCAYKADNFSIEIYQFDDEYQVKNFHLSPYHNGYFGMLIHKPQEGKLKDKIIDAFKSF